MEWEEENTGSIYLPGIPSSFNSAMNTSFEICGSWTPILTSFAKFGGLVSVFPILWVSMGSSFMCLVSVVRFACFAPEVRYEIYEPVRGRHC